MASNRLDLPVSFRLFVSVAFILRVWLAPSDCFATDGTFTLPEKASGTIRVATFNVSLHRKKFGELSTDLEKGDLQAERIAKVVQYVAPDVLLANEVDYDGGKSAQLLLDKYFLEPGQSGSQNKLFKHFYAPPVNTGVQSELDLNHDGKVGSPEDAWGYGEFDGQYGFAIFSRFPIDDGRIRSFQKFPWSRMPGALQPTLVNSTPYWSTEIWNELRLSSKNHIDLPVRVGRKVLHIIASHPTPPVFDGPEDRNGCRNHDEIRLIADYVEGGDNAKYIVDDQGQPGGLSGKQSFVIVGDLNADPIDGSGRQQAINRLLQSERVNASVTPKSLGGKEAAELQGRMNLNQKGDAAEDTGDFNDGNPGNLRCDFVLPSSNIEIVASGVFWPTKAELEQIDKDLLKASDHRLVWVDIRLP